MGNFLSKQINNTNNINKLIWYDIEENEIIKIDNFNEIIKIDNKNVSGYISISENFNDNDLSSLDIHTTIIYNNLNTLINTNLVHSKLESYKLIKNYIINNSLNFNELLSKNCMCYFLYWELRPFRKDNIELEFVFTRFQNRFGWDINDKRY